MKSFLIFALSMLFLNVCALHAQTDLQNTGTLYLSGSSDILYITGSFNNASGSALTNNGNLYVLQNLANDQSSVAIGTGTLYFNGSALETLSGSQVFNTYNLVTNNASGILLNNDLNVNGVHTFTAGIISSSSTPNYLMYAAGSSYTGDGDTKHVKGWVRKTGNTAFSFPLGNDTVERTIGISSLSASSVFNANYAGATNNTGSLAPPLVVVDPYEYWILNEVSGGSAIVNMNWDNSKIPMPPFVITDIRVANYLSALWTQEGSGATGSYATTGNISSNTLSSFGPFTFGSITQALSVNLIQFSAYNNDGNAMLNWTTNNELNVKDYDVQRSDDGTFFYSVGDVPAHNLPALQQYELADLTPLQTTTYYRLRITDANGKIKLSQVITINTAGLPGNYLTVTNPAHNSIHLNIQHMSGIYSYRLNAVNGQVLQQGSMNITAPGIHDIYLLPAIKTGVYVLEIEKAGFNFSTKIVIQ